MSYACQGFYNFSVSEFLVQFKYEYIRIKMIKWKIRHLIVILFASLSVYLIEQSSDWTEMHSWNRAAGGTSLFMIACALIIGPLTKIFPRSKWILPWRRELGIYAVIFALIHITIIIVEWVDWDLFLLFGFESDPSLEGYIMTQRGFGISNLLGVVAIFYGFLLAFSSNDLSQKFLGGSAWKFLQQAAHIFWILVLLHTAYFLYFHFLDFDKDLPEPSWLKIPFLILIVVVISLRIIAYIKMVKRQRQQRTDEISN